MREVDSCGLDCGKEANDWMTERLFPNKRRLQLLYMGNLDVKRCARKPTYFEFPSFKKSDVVSTFLN